MNEFKTDVQGTKGIYTIEYRTNSRANYEETQELLRKFVDNKPKTNFDKITESVESLAEFLSTHIEHYLAPKEVKQIQVDSIDNRTGQGLTWAKAFEEWLQKECE